MNTFILSCNMKQVPLHNRMLVDLKFYLLCGRLQNLRVGKSSASAPHVTSTGVFGINLNTLYTSFWSFKEVFSTMNKAIGVIKLYHPHLAIEVL